MSTATLEQQEPAPATAGQTTWIGNGNEAVARAIIDIGYDAEGYYPITPSSDVGEEVSKAVAAGKSDIAYIVGTSELAALSICAGVAAAGGRVVDVTSANGLLLKAEEMPAISGLGLPMVLNLSTRDVSAPLNIKNGHSDLYASLGWGWITFLAPTVQACYDLNIIAIKIAEAVNLPAIVAYDGFHTSHANRRIMVFEDQQVVRRFVGPPPFKGTLKGENGRFSFLDVKHPRTVGPYMNDDLINTKVQLDLKFEKVYKLLPDLFEQYAALSGRRYDFVDQYGDADAEHCLVALNSAGETAKDVVDEKQEAGAPVNLVMPTVLRPWPEQQIVDALGKARRIVVAERGSQYGANNYLANEIGAALQRRGNDATIIQRCYGIGGLNFMRGDAQAMYKLAAEWPNVADEDAKRVKWYHGAWPGDESYSPAQTLTPLTAEQCTHNAGQGNKVNLPELSRMPSRIDKHSACPGCGIFTTLDLFLRGIDGHVVLLFNTGCGMVVTTGYPLTSFKVNYLHNLFHNGTSTATGVVEMIKRFKKRGDLPEEITAILVTGDGGDDIGMDQLIGAALRNDPFIVLEYDNKGYMNTGAQLCYTGFKGQRNSNAHIGPNQTGKPHHHKDVIEILRGTFASYIATAAESHPLDMIRKARKAQQAVRDGGFAFVKTLSACPLNWLAPENACVASISACVNACLHPLLEIESGVTRITFDPDRKKQRIPVTEALNLMGGAFAHIAKPEYAELAADVQQEVDRRWARLKAMAASDVL